MNSSKTLNSDGRGTARTAVYLAGYYSIVKELVNDAETNAEELALDEADFRLSGRSPERLSDRTNVKPCSLNNFFTTTINNNTKY